MYAHLWIRMFNSQFLPIMTPTRIALKGFFFFLHFYASENFCENNFCPNATAGTKYCGLLSRSQMSANFSTNIHMWDQARFSQLNLSNWKGSGRKFHHPYLLKKSLNWFFLNPKYISLKILIIFLIQVYRKLKKKMWHCGKFI